MGRAISDVFIGPLMGTKCFGMVDGLALKHLGGLALSKSKMKSIPSPTANKIGGSQGQNPILFLGWENIAVYRNLPKQKSGIILDFPLSNSPVAAREKPGRGTLGARLEKNPRNLHHRPPFAPVIPPPPKAPATTISNPKGVPDSKV